MFIAAAAGVKLASNVYANNLVESALVGSEDVLISSRDDGESASLPLHFDLMSALLELLKLLLGDDTSLWVWPGKGSDSHNVLLVEHPAELDEKTSKSSDEAPSVNCTPSGGGALTLNMKQRLTAFRSATEGQNCCWQDPAKEKKISD